MEGRIAVRFGEDSLSGKLAWAHLAERDELSLASPLGNVLARIVRDAGGVVLTNSFQEQFRAVDAETLTERQLGWRLPLAGLAQWILARPSTAPGAGLVEGERDASRRWQRLRQAGWEIDFDYENDAATLPKRVVLNYSRADKPLEIRVAIDRWSLPE